MPWLDLIVGFIILFLIGVLYVVTSIKFPWKKSSSEALRPSFLEFQHENDKQCHEWEPWDPDKDERKP